mgnify:CR=1 FL=1
MKKNRNNSIYTFGIKDYNDSIDIKESNKTILLGEIENRNEINIFNKKRNYKRDFGTEYKRDL